MERRRARTRDALLAAAQQLLSMRPAEGVNIDEIVEIADVAKGTFYNYFVDKEAIVREVEEAARTHLEALIAQTNAGVADAGVRMARAFCAALGFALSDPHRAMTLLRISPHATDPDTPINMGVRRDVRSGLDSGRFKFVTEEAGVVLALSVIQGGVSRTLDLQEAHKVEALGESLGASLLVALGIERDEAMAIVKEAMAPLV